MPDDNLDQIPRRWERTSITERINNSEETVKSGFDEHMLRVDGEELEKQKMLNIVLRVLKKVKFHL